MYMKAKLKFLVLLMTLVPFLAYAQEPGQGGGGQRQRMSPEERAKVETQRLKESLVLNDSQTLKIEKINLKYNQLTRETFQNSQGDTAKMRKDITELDLKKSEEVKPLLTPEQFTKYQQLQKERRSRWGQGGRGPNGGNRPQ